MPSPAVNRSIAGAFLLLALAVFIVKSGGSQLSSSSDQALTVAAFPAEIVSPSRPKRVKFAQQESFGLLPDLANELARSEAIGTKTLPTLEERRELGESLADRELITACTKHLIVSNDVRGDPEAFENERLRRVDFLTRAARWSENPSRVEVFQAIRNVVLNARAAETSTVKVKRSIAGDRIELAMALLDADLSSFEELTIAASQDPSTSKLVQYARNHYQYQRAQGVQR